MCIKLTSPSPSFFVFPLHQNLQRARPRRGRRRFLNNLGLKQLHTTSITSSQIQPWKQVAALIYNPQRGLPHPLTPSLLHTHPHSWCERGFSLRLCRWRLLLGDVINFSPVFKHKPTWLQKKEPVFHSTCVSRPSSDTHTSHKRKYFNYHLSTRTFASCNYHSGICRLLMKRVKKNKRFKIRITLLSEVTFSSACEAPQNKLQQLKVKRCGDQNSHP